MDEEDNVSDEELLDALDGLLLDASAAHQGVLHGLRRQQQQRAARLENTGDRLRQSLGADHPRVIGLSRAGSFASEMGRQLQMVARRQARRPSLKSYEWMVFGRVVDSGGKPIAGLTVEVHDQDRRYDDLLGTATTDEYGDFAVTYHERAFQEYGEELPELYVTLKNSSGESIYTTEDSARFESSRVEYFELVYDPDAAP